jgi:hypothetical protein
MTYYGFISSLYFCQLTSSKIIAPCGTQSLGNFLFLAERGRMLNISCSCGKIKAF